MRNEQILKSIIAKCLILAMSISAVPGNVWAQTQNNQMLQHQANATSSNADEFIGEEGEAEISDDDMATDSDAAGKAAIENLALLTNPVPYETVTLDGRRFSAIISVDAVSYYHVLKYTVPEGRGGYYTIDAESVDDYTSLYLYVCNEEQYETLCNKIETRGYPTYASVPTECLAYESYESLGYWLEDGQDYYFIAAGSSSYYNEVYNLTLTRDIEVTLDCLDAASAGTSAVYSKGSDWYSSSNREWSREISNITRPEKSGYRFEGYYTAPNGQGIQVIDDLGEFLPEMNELPEDCTVYADWKPFSPVSYQEIQLEGRRFVRVLSGGEYPYYQVYKFTVPEGSGGSYSFYQSSLDDDINAAGYLCTSEQYESVCHQIEQNKGFVRIWGLQGLLNYDSNRFSINYRLEAGKDYYFIATRQFNDSEGDYKVVFERDITVTLAAPDAEQPGTASVYSKGGNWLGTGNYWGLNKIKRPQRDGYKFAGYFTGENGQGVKVIDYDGGILDALGSLDTDATVYAHWENFTPVIYTDILLEDGRFGVTGIAEEVPYYKVLKFKVPEHGEGYYTFYYNSDEDINMSGFLCTAAQYENLCRKIEADGELPSGLSSSADYLKCDTMYFNISRQLESGQEYFFVAARESKMYDGEGEYQLLFRRDIEVVLDAAEAEVQGTAMLYSMGNRWSRNSNRDWENYNIRTPRRAGYLFAGYFTGKNGQGKMLIDQDGYIDDEEMYELKDNTTIYALWEDENTEFKTGYLPDGIKGIPYKQKLAIASKMNFYWWVSEGELPEGLEVDLFNGYIWGRPTETGTKTFVISARNSQTRLSKEFTITINEPTYSGSDEEHSGTWRMDETGNWRYYSNGSNYYSNEWKYLEYNGVSHWYYFGSDGHVNTGWFADNAGKWYYLNPLSNGTRGAMQTGWLTDPLDGNRYYLDPQTGQMAIGWVHIDDVWYYFTESGGAYSGWKWDESAGSWQYENIGKRPTGALEPDKKRE